MDKFFSALKIISITGIAVILVSFFDLTLAMGLLFLSVLICGTFLFFRNSLVNDRYLVSILIITIIIHLSAVLFVYCAHFQPFGGGEGDYVEYNSYAQYFSGEFKHGNFSDLFAKNYIDNYSNYYAAIIGIVYALVLPEMIVGQLFNVWLALLSILAMYFLIKEIGGSKSQAFWGCFIANLYPSWIFYGSLLLKDSLVVLLALTGALFAIKLIKNFSWGAFLIFYILLLVLTHFRFYVSYSIIIAFMICWMVFSDFKIKKRTVYALIFILLLGFLPQISGYGYMGIKTLRSYLSPSEVANFREKIYVSQESSEISLEGKAPGYVSQESSEIFSRGKGSSFSATADFHNPVSFLINYMKTYVYTLFGPFPWQIRLKRQLFALAEVLPWYIIFIFIVRGLIKSIREDGAPTVFLLIFSFLVLGVLALFTPNFGIITRIRMPAILALVSFAPFGIAIKNKYIEKIKIYLEKKVS
jgi:hypothetical protein